MSADLLRAAADRLDALADAATPGPHGWRLADLAGANEVWADRDAGGYDAFMVASTATRLNPNPGARGHADAAYIATMSPPVAKALAAWLRQWADHFDSWDADDREAPCCAGPADGACNDAALTLASLITADPP